MSIFLKILALIVTLAVVVYVNETNRLRNEALVNDLLSELIVSIHTTPTKSHVLAQLEVILSKADDFDSEDQERLASYMEEALRILHIDSSNELLNVWRFGFPYGSFLSRLSIPGDNEESAR